MPITTQQFMSHVRENPVNDRLLSTLPSLGLPHCALTAGCLFQTVWNLKSGNEPGHGIKDYDVFYFDDSDLSWEAEDQAIRRAKDALGELSEKVEIKNQARVHLWYSEKFGRPYPILRKVEDGIDRYLISCTRLGINVADCRVYSPDKFDDMWNGVLRINPLNAQPDLFRNKCQEYLSRWPWLVIAA
ncbi:nucleotidyltransferase family protein [Sinorhizobium sp. 6-70]|nr:MULTISPECIES: nucleotidyltransferase family protein [unclassified Sinorhizobium]MDK1375233.1 nucleotidyltransferase family protein [Sinorhizobium sp. 6-70]MDK1478039.1 nucleotidyltransferase family protein [Sinorhizobium sp. 6-117]